MFVITAKSSLIYSLQERSYEQKMFVLVSSIVGLFGDHHAHF